MLSLPEDMIMHIADAADANFSILAMRATCTRLQICSDKMLRVNYEEDLIHLFRHLSITRARQDGHLRMKDILLKRNNSILWATTPLTCARCKQEIYEGILTCRCHRRQPNRVFYKIFTGPICVVMCLGLVTAIMRRARVVARLV